MTRQRPAVDVCTRIAATDTISSIGDRKNYEALNGIRGVASIAVLLYHAGALIGAIVPRGYLAVDLFFTLSGFVIAHAYGDRLTAGLSLRAFVAARLLRFWPLYALGLGLGLVRELLLLATGNAYALPLPLLASMAAVGLIFLPFPLDQRGGALFPINIPSWSLFFELLVNILYALLRPVLGTTTLVIIVASAAIAFILLAPTEGIDREGVALASFSGGCVRTVLSFMVGVLIHRVQPRLPALPVSLLLILVAMALVMPWGGRTYDLLFVLVLSPAIVVLGAAAKTRGRIATITDWLGLISFPLYAVHRPLLALAEALSGRVSVAPALIGWVSAIALVGLCGVLPRAFDVPMRSLIQRHLQHRSA